MAQMLIAGERAAAAGGAETPVVNPATEEVLGTAVPVVCHATAVAGLPPARLIADVEEEDDILWHRCSSATTRWPWLRVERSR